MGHMTTHNQWYKRLTNGATERAAAILSGVTTSTLNRQLAKGKLSADVVILLSRAYGESPISGLAATGYLTADEAVGMPTDSLTELLTDQQLIRSLALRINADPSAWLDTFGELEDAGEVGSTERPTSVSLHVATDDYDDGTVRKFDWSEPHAADSSIDEDAERERRGEDPVD